MQNLTPATLPGLLVDLSDQLLLRRYRLCTAESCTGGLIAAHCTSLPGSSRWFDRAFVTYSNAAKSQMLGVPDDLILEQGAVSEAVVLAMAQGACLSSGAQCSIAVSGIAGPDGGSLSKPVGTVWLGICVNGRARALHCQFKGSREHVRHQSVVTGIHELLLSLRQVSAGA